MDRTSLASRPTLRALLIYLAIWGVAVAYLAATGGDWTFPFASLLIFGVATMDALTSRNWFRIVFWIAMAIAFAALDYMGQRRRMSSR